MRVCISTGNGQQNCEAVSPEWNDLTVDLRKAEEADNEKLFQKDLSGLGEKGLEIQESIAKELEEVAETLGDADSKPLDDGNERWQLSLLRQRMVSTRTSHRRLGTTIAAKKCDSGE